MSIRRSKMPWARRKDGFSGMCGLRDQLSKTMSAMRKRVSSAGLMLEMGDVQLVLTARKLCRVEAMWGRIGVGLVAKGGEMAR
jgi:hypothetical protein